MADVIGNPTLRAEFDGTAVLKGAASTGAKLRTTFEESNRAVEKTQRDANKRIQGLINQINAEKPKRQMLELAQAVQLMGGRSALSEGQVSRLAVQVNQLAAAGAKVPASLAGMTSGVNKLGAAFTSLITGGGISGALAMIGPAGLVAGAALGVTTAAVARAAGAVKDLAAQAEGWSNISAATGISVESVQRLGDFLEDAGFSADDLTTMMKKLQVEIATGGKAFEKYGINLAQIKSLAPEEQLRAIAAAVTAIVDPTERAAAAQEFFGKRGSAHLAALRGIAEGTYTKLHALSLEQIADLKRVDDELDEAGRTWENWKKRALLAMIDVSSFSTKLGENIRKNLQTQFGGLGGAPNVGDTRRGSIFNPPKLLVPKGPSDWELEAERQANEKRASVEAALLARKKELADLLARAAESARKLAFKLIADAPGGPTTKFQGVDTIMGSRGFGMGTMVGAKNFDFGIDAKGFVTFGNAAEEAARQAAEGAAKLAKAEKKTETFFSGLLQGAALLAGAIGGRMGDAINTIGNVGTSFKGFSKMSGTDRFNTIASGAGQVGGLIGGKAGGALAGAAGGAMMGAAVGSVVPVIGTVIGGVIGGIAGGIAGFISGGKKAKQQMEDMKKQFIEGAGGLSALTMRAQAAGASLDKLFAAKDAKALNAAMLEVQKTIDTFEAKMNGLKDARAAAEALMDRVAQGGFSEKFGAAVGVMVQKVQDALLRSGLGYMASGPLRGSESFMGAQGAAGEVAQLLAGMRGAGMVDTGLMGAAATSSQELFDQAVAAAIEAGQAPEEAQKAGFGAISQLLREQLNASVQSGEALDANTQKLLDEAKANGINIMADPMIESLEVQKEQLGVLRQIAGGRGSQGGGTVPAARGLGPVRMPNIGGGLGPLIQTHAGELALVLPASMARGGLIHAARGIYEDDADPRGHRGDGGGGGETGSPGDTGSGSVSAEKVAALAVQVTALAQAMKAREPIVVNNAPVLQVVDQSMVKTAEGQRAFGKYVQAEMERALDQNSRGLTSKVEQIARRAVA